MVDQKIISKASESIKINQPQKPSPLERWEEPLKEHLKILGGSQLKDIQFEEVQPLTFNFGGHPIAAKSLVVKLKNVREEVTAFKLIIDGSNGKILQSWARPIMDSANPREEFRIKIDERQTGP